MKIWDSVCHYLADLGHLGLLLLAAVLLDGLGAYEYVSGRQISPLPSWSLILFGFLLALLVPFIAYHRMRLRVRDAIEARRGELSRLVLRTRDAAGKLMMLKDAAPQRSLEGGPALARYEEAIENLRVEAEIEGGEVKRAVSEFLSFVTFHLARLAGGMPVYGSGAKEVDLGVYQVLGRMADRADEVIRKIRRLI